MPTALAVLKTYFNSDPDTKKPLKEFSAELKELDPKDKAELAQLAAQELGVEVTESTTK